MGIKFLVGSSGTGKTTAILNEIREKLKEDPYNGKPILFLVPDQMTFQMEYELMKTPELEGIIRAQVLSFNRLAWRVLQEEGGISRTFISQTGMNMFLRKIIEEKKHEFKVFSKASEKKGFIEHIEQMITEMKRYIISPDMLDDQVKKLAESHDHRERILSDKLKDLAGIYRSVEKLFADKYIDSEDYLQLLSEKIYESSYMDGAEIYIDGFHNFTPQELQVVESMMKTASSITIALTLDKPPEEAVADELHLFYMTAETFSLLKKMAERNNISIDEVAYMTDRKRFIEEPSLVHLEKMYSSHTPEPFHGDSAIVFMQAVNRRAEIEGIAREIIRLVRDEGVRFREIALLIRNMSDYRDLLEQLFQDYEIPFFIDEKSSMTYHPLIEFIRSSLEVITGNWRYEAVFRTIKTEFLYPLDADKAEMRKEMDQLENYVLAYGIQGKKWTDQAGWTYRKYHSFYGNDKKTDEEEEIEKRINQLRKLIVEPLQALENKMKRAKTGRDMAEALYMYLEQTKVPDKLELLRLDAENGGNLIEAREHDQVWNAVIELLDEFVEIMGDQEISIHLFREMVETGMESMKFSLVPPAIDQVIVATLDRSRLYGIKMAFIAGANDGVLPAKPVEDGVLTDDERELLYHNGVKLAPTARRKLLDENFLIYLALASAKQKLYLSYSLADEEGKALMPSIIVKRLKEMFPDAKEMISLNEPESEEAEEQLSFIVSPNVSLSVLTSKLQNWKKQYPLHELWWDVYNYFVYDQEWSSKAKKAIASLFYSNTERPLSEEVSRKLYGRKIQGSVSRMERFRACPFAHFASHGLKLKEREYYRLEAPDIGQLFHAALKLMADRLQSMKVEWRELTKENCERLAHDAVEQLAPKLQKEILMSTNRHYYIKRKLQNIVARASKVLSEHAKASGFVPIGLEISFDEKSKLPPFRFKLENGCTLEVVGRIDRVDKAESSKGLLLRIVDFKSSDKTLNLAEVYYGIALQMLTYLDVVISNSQSWLGVEATPAGVLYFHIHDPFIQSPDLLTDDEIEEEILKKFKMKGLLLGDEETVRLMDQKLESGYSKIVQAGIKKTGEFYANSQIASEDEFHALRSYIRREFKRIGTEITDGNISIAPYKMKEKTPCTFCSFKSVCQFDESIETNRFRILKSLKGEEVLQKVREKVDSDEE
ncbi:helicase-exonuclease AddAB subunit AddB [Aeribacillus sp. FSL M8-0235]|uniref:helicase-exonuclease AddAB subunit AddB n=1 Tax=Aeribacillus sp. FSL M8-0235 TaxID=2954576 RepID=UPI0030F9CA1A